VVHGVFAPGTVLQGQSLIVGLAESEDLEDLNFLTPQRRSLTFILTATRGPASMNSVGSNRLPLS
jgi:hypothetical protein